jgi:uncharacterized protein YndB with AHSA1/START domain
VWTSRIATWWPKDHTVSGGADLSVVFEPGVGGRIYERTAAGDEHEWGQVTGWEPPTRLAYHWYLGRDASVATDVEVHFVATGPGFTRVDIEHRGWERLGESGEEWRGRNRAGWASLLPHFQVAIEKGAN